MKWILFFFIVITLFQNHPVVVEDDICVKLLQMTADIQECWKGGNPPPPSSNCNVFVGRVLKEIYGYDDFWNKNVGQYYSANNIYLNLIVGNNWNSIGTCDKQENLQQAQELANEGKCVIAAWFNSAGDGHGHVAIVVKGSLSRSGQWQLDVPNSASYSNSPANQFVCDKLSKAFGAEKKSTTILYYK